MLKLYCQPFHRQLVLEQTVTQTVIKHTQKGYINTCSVYLDIRSLLPASRCGLHLLQILELFGLLLVLLRKKLGGQHDWQDCRPE